MKRLLHNHILGGVCSGLGAITLVNVWVWRIAWLVLIGITGGVAGILYVMWWWLLPEQSFDNIEVGRFLTTLSAIACAIAVIGGWFAREYLQSVVGADLYLPSVLILTSLVYLSQQFDRATNARNHPILGVVALAVAGYGLIAGLDVLPSGIHDTIDRALPAVLIFLGLSVILRARIPSGSFIALLISIAIASIIAVIAFSSRVGQVLEDNVIRIEQAIPSTATLTLDMSALNSDVELRTGTQDNQVIATFKGSNEHTLSADFAITDENIAILILTEAQNSLLPSLPAMGRGTIDVQLPPNLAVFIKLAITDGDATLNLRDLRLESIETLDIQQGDALISLPAYQSLSPSARDSGAININNGSLTLRVPNTLGIELFLSKATNARPDYDETTYLLEDRGDKWRLSQQAFDNLSIKASYIASVPTGTISMITID